MVEKAVEVHSFQMPGSLHAHLVLLWGAHPSCCTWVLLGLRGETTGASWCFAGHGVRVGGIVSCPH